MAAPPPSRFAVVTHMPNIRQTMDPFTGDPDYTLDFFPISYTKPLLAARQLLDEGYEVILYYSSLGPSILKDIGHSVVIIPKTDLDIIKPLRRASEFSRDIALTVHRDDDIDVRFIEELLDIRIHAIVFDSLETLSQGLQSCVAQGRHVLVGGGLSYEMAKQYNIRFFRIEPNMHCISLAMAQAKAMAKAKREERESRDQLVAVLRLFREGVLCVNQAGKTIFSNSRAAELLKTPRRQRDADNFSQHHKALMIDDVLADGEPRENVIVNVQGEELVVTTLPISLHAWLQGAVAFISDVNSIHNIAGQLREIQRQAGFVARYHVEDIKGATPEMHRLKKMAGLYAPHSTAVWIHGETGTGKELLAQSMHNASPRSGHPFVAVNCAALPESLLESELFGYAEGAFTGAKRGGKPGVFEMAHKGTLFLDEVGDMGPGAQSRLLRVLETRELVRVGGDRVVPVDIRVLSASHKPLMDLVREGVFRQDLFYRLAVLRLHLPPLRQRVADIPLLLERLMQRYGKSVRDLTPAMLRAMGEYAWPGNIRELHAFVESYLILLGAQAADQALFLELLGSWTGDEAAAAGEPGPAAPDAPAAPAGSADLKAQLGRARQEIAQRMLRECRGNRRLAASRLGISYNTLWRILDAGAGGEPPAGEAGPDRDGGDA